MRKPAGRLSTMSSMSFPKIGSTPFYLKAGQNNRNACFGAAQLFNTYFLRCAQWAPGYITYSFGWAPPLPRLLHCPVFPMLMLAFVWEPISWKFLGIFGQGQYFLGCAQWGPLHTRAKSCDHGISGAQTKVSRGRPKACPISCSAVTGPQLWCEVICHQALNQMIFQWISIHAGPQPWWNRVNQWLWAFGVKSSCGFILRLPPRGGLWK